MVPVLPTAGWLALERRTVPAREPSMTKAESLAPAVRWCPVPRARSAVASHRARLEPRVQHLAQARSKASSPPAACLMRAVPKLAAVRSRVLARQVRSAEAQRKAASLPEAVVWAQPSVQQRAEAAAEMPSELQPVAAVEARLSGPLEAAGQPSAQQEAVAAEAQPSEVREAEAAQPWAPRPAEEVEAAVRVAVRQPEAAAAGAQPSAVRVVVGEQPWAAPVAEVARLWEAQGAAEVVLPSVRRPAVDPWAAASACRRDRVRPARPARGPWVRCGAVTRRTSDMRPIGRWWREGRGEAVS